MLRPAAPGWPPVEPQTGLAGVLRAGPEHSAQDEALNPETRADSAGGRRMRQPGLGAGFHARRALRRPAVPHPQRDRRGQPRGAGDPGGAVSARLDAHPHDGPAGRLVRRTEIHPHGQRTGDDQPRIRRVGPAEHVKVVAA